LNIINKRLMLNWLEYIFKFSFKNGLSGDKSALFQRFTANFAVSREKCAYFSYFSYTVSRFKILSNPVVPVVSLIV